LKIDYGMLNKVANFCGGFIILLDMDFDMGVKIFDGWKSNVNKFDNTLFTKIEKNLVVERSICYFVNLGYGKFVKQFVTQELYNEFKLKFVVMKVPNTLSLFLVYYQI